MNKMSIPEKREQCMKILRKEVGLSSREAEAYVMRAWAYPGALAEEWGISWGELDAIYTAAKQKIVATGKSDKELFGQYYMPRTTFVS